VSAVDPIETDEAAALSLSQTGPYAIYPIRTVTSYSMVVIILGA
jgi:hypothetical protein